jgi:hypothetical protein
MRRLTGLLAVLLLGWAAPASAIRVDATYAETTGAAADHDQTFSESVLDANNLARASTSSGGVGVEGRVDGLSGGSANAQAEWSEVWSAPASTSSLFISGLHATGTLSPALAAALLTPGADFGFLYYLRFLYQLDVDTWVDITIDYDAGLSNPIRASWQRSASSGVVDLTPLISWGTNAAGNTTFALHAFGGAPPGATACGGGFGVCGTTESMSVTLNIADYGPGYGGTPYSGVLAADLLHTFSVELQSGDPAAEWTSEGGRVIGATVPEPHGLLLMLLGLGALRAAQARGSRAR